MYQQLNYIKMYLKHVELELKVEFYGCCLTEVLQKFSILSLKFDTN